MKWENVVAFTVSYSVFLCCLLFFYHNGGFEADGLEVLERLFYYISLALLCFVGILLTTGGRNENRRRD